MPILPRVILRSPLPWALVVLLCATASRLGAASDNDTLLAESLYQSGKKLFDEGKYAEACPKLSQSQRLDPAGGTALLLATCWDKAGRTASAVTAYQEAISLARRDRRADREKVGTERLKALEAEVPRLLITLSSGARAIAGVEVQRDAEALIPEALGVELLVDPGPHTVRASARGYSPFELSFELAAREHKRVEIPALTRLAEPAPSASAPASAAPRPPPPAPSPPASSEPEPAPASGGRATVGLVLGGAGLVLAGVGGYFGIHSASQKSDIQARCPAKQCDDPATVDLSKKAIREANYANVLLPLGLAAAGAGAFLYFTAPRSSPTTARWAPSVGPGYAGLVVLKGF